MSWLLIFSHNVLSGRKDYPDWKKQKLFRTAATGFDSFKTVVFEKAINRGPSLAYLALHMLYFDHKVGSKITPL